MYDCLWKILSFSWGNKILRISWPFRVVKLVWVTLTGTPNSFRYFYQLLSLFFRLTCTIVVPSKILHFFSNYSLLDSLSCSSAFLMTGTDYPVSTHSFIKISPYIITPSKGSLTLSLKNTISPGTIFKEEILYITLFLNTFRGI